LSDKKCPCGRNFPVIEQIIGRTDDILITRDGRQIGRLDPVFKGLKSIKEAQIVQEDHDNIILRIIPGKDYQDNDGQIVVSELKKRLGSNVVIKVRIETLIERTSAGKFRSVISKVRKV
jgi:phenylacetate-CoA ligase